MADAMPYSTPIYAVGRQVHRLNLIECAECDWCAVSDRVPDNQPHEAWDRWEAHHAVAHAPQTGHTS